MQTEHISIDMDGVEADSAEQVDTSSEEEVKKRKANLEKALDVSALDTQRRDR